MPYIHFYIYEESHTGKWHVEASTDSCVWDFGHHESEDQARELIPQYVEENDFDPENYGISLVSKEEFV